MMRSLILISSLLAVISMGCSTAAAKQEPLAGSWGGPHIGLELTPEGGALEYDCAHGTIDGPVVLDRAGRFEAAGTHVSEHGGPVREGEQEQGRPARYRGKVSGETLTLTVILVESNEEIGTFRLTRGAAPRIMRCL